MNPIELNVSQTIFGKGKFSFPSGTFNFLGVDKPGVSVYFNGVEVNCNIPVYSTLLNRIFYRFTKEIILTKTNFTEIEFSYSGSDTYTIFSAFRGKREYFSDFEIMDLLTLKNSAIFKYGNLVITDGMINVQKDKYEIPLLVPQIFSLSQSIGVLSCREGNQTSQNNQNTCEFPIKFLVSII